MEHDPLPLHLHGFPEQHPQSASLEQLQLTHWQLLLVGLAAERKELVMSATPKKHVAKIFI
jgi:hypothetical protein